MGLQKHNKTKRPTRKTGINEPKDCYETLFKSRKPPDSINSKTKLGDLRKIAKEIKKDHELAMELWSTGGFLPRQLAILIMDSKLLSQDLINKLDKDMQAHPFYERSQLIDWLMANQLTKDKKTALIESWEDSLSALQRRVFWYYQARLRWVGQTPPANTAELLSKIEVSIANEEPEVHGQ